MISSFLLTFCVRKVHAPKTIRWWPNLVFTNKGTVPDESIYGEVPFHGFWHESMRDELR